MDEILNRLEKLKEESLKLRAEVRERTVGYIVVALGLVAGLAWNEAIKSLIEYLFPFNQNTVWAKFAYALLLSLILVVATMLLLRWAQPRIKNQREAGQAGKSADQANNLSE